MKLNGSFFVGRSVQDPGQPGRDAAGELHHVDRLMPNTLSLIWHQPDADIRPDRAQADPSQPLGHGLHTTGRHISVLVKLKVTDANASCR